jgi:hypothetical protein
VTIAEPATTKCLLDHDEVHVQWLFPLPFTAFEQYTLLDGDTDAGLVANLLDPPDSLIRPTVASQVLWPRDSNLADESSRPRPQSPAQAD